MAITPIYEIQGSAHTSPLLGQSVTTSGIVTAVDTNGFYLQDATGDNNNATSDAIFVFTSDAPGVTVGDDVEVTGTVSEFFPGGQDTGNLSTTQISGSPTVTINSSGNDLPEATIIGTGGRVPPTENIDDDAFTSFDPDTDGIDFFESLEAMRVTAKDALAIAPTNRFGEIFTVVDNGTGATGISNRGTLNISPDDFNPEKVQIDADSDILPGFEFPEVDTGAQLGDVTGVVSYSFGNFEINPTEAFTVTPSTLQPETTTIEGSEDKLTVASYNVLNLDPNDSDGDTDVANGRFDAIASQIVNNLNAPDIIGLQEVQDNNGSEDAGVISADETLQQLADAIATAGGPTYSFIDNTFIGNDTSGGQPVGNIRTAYLYNTERVGLVEGSVESIQDSDQQTNPENPFFDARLPLVAKFTFNGEEVTVVNNHFSSKGGSSPILGVEQPFEARQEEVAVNGSLDERQAQSQAVKDYVDGILTADENANVVVLGDLNEFEFVSPVETLEDNLTNLSETVPEDERYSFIFQGNSQYLDHILVSDNLADTAEFDAVHVNSEFADTDEKASDHDPLIASLSLTDNKENMDKINLSQVGTFTSEDGAEIVAHDPNTQRLFVTTGDTVEIINISEPENPTKFGEIDVTSIDGVTYGGANSVAVMNGIVAVAVEADTAQDNGVVAFYDTDGVFQNSVTVGALPDMLTFTPDGMKVIVANEGEPNDTYDNDPEGSISIIDISGGVAGLTQANVSTADFTAFNDDLETLKADGVRIFGRTADGTDATVAQDVEPEYIAVSPDGTKAFVTLQENNAVAVLDIATATVEAIKPLGFKDYNAEGNGIDASNRDDGINIQNWPVFGMYQPDSIDSFEVDGQTYYITANEGDARIRPDGDIEVDGNVITEEGDIFNEEARIGDDEIVLDPVAFPNAEELKQDENLGRLKITNTLGDTDGDGDFDELYSYGARSFSIWDSDGNLVFDSGDAIAQITASQTPEIFNSDESDPDEFDNRSDDKGAEPEAVTVGMVDGKTYGFIGLERTGGVLVYDLSNPEAPEFQQYIRTEGDAGPEGLKFIAADESPNGKPMLAVANEDSNTTTLYDIQPTSYTLQILHTSDLEGGQDAIEDAPNFAAIVDKLEDDFDNTIVLSAGDNYLPGAFFDAADNQLLNPTLQKVYEELYNLPEGSLSGLESSSGRIDNAIMNIIGFDASALGNHEFDKGTEKIADIIDADIEGDNFSDVKWLGAQFPYLSANLDFSEDANLNPLFTSEIKTTDEFFPLDTPGTLTADDLSDLNDAPKIAPATIIEEGGEKIGVVGATTQLLDSISSPGNTKVKGVGEDDMQALADILNPVINQLQTDSDINKIVLVSHLQDINLEKQLVPLLNGVDVVIAGGSDTRLADSNDRLREGDEAQGEYPVITANKDGNSAVIVSTDGQYSYVGRLVVDFDAEGNVITGSIDPNVSGAYATDSDGVTAVWGEEDPFAEGTKGELVKQLTDEVQEVALNVADGNVLGFTDVFLQGERDPGVRTEETNLGNLTADANLAIAKEFDPTVMVSIKNGGGIRASIGDKENQTPPPANPDAVPPQAEGGISQLDIQTTLAFNNELTLLTVTAKELEQILEHAVAEAPTADGQFPQVSGLRFSFNDENQAIEFGQDAEGNATITTDGERIQSLAIVDENGNIVDTIAEDGEIVGDPNREIRLVTLSFLADIRDNGLGGDGYPFSIFGDSRVDLTEVLTAEGDATFADPGTEQDALAEYLLDNFPTEAEAFDIADVPVAQDMRIQNLDFREDTVLEGLIEEISAATLADGTTVESIDLTGFTGQATINYTISREADFDNEVYFYEVDNINGTVDGIAVGEEGYMEAALANIISPVFSTSDDNTETLDAEFNAGSVVVPLIIADGTLAEALSGEAEIYFPYLGANTDNGTFDHIKLLDSRTFGFEDLPNGGDQDFNDIEIRINSIA